MVLNMALDAALVVLPIVMLWNVQMPLVQRLKGNDEHQRHHRLYPESLPRDHQSSPRNEHRPYARGHRAELHGKLHETQLAFNAQILQIVQAESRPRE
ncbi:hypothetical protein ACP6JE_006180 [Aspergillus fumigatus]